VLPTVRKLLAPIHYGKPAGGISKVAAAGLPMPNGPAVTVSVVVNATT